MAFAPKDLKQYTQCSDLLILSNTVYSYTHQLYSVLVFQIAQKIIEDDGIILVGYVGLYNDSLSTNREWDHHSWGPICQDAALAADQLFQSPFTEFRLTTI